MTSEKDVLETRYLDLEASHEKTSSRLQLRIQGLEHDLRMTLEALRATKTTDARGKILCRSSEVFRVSIYQT